ncbi:TetR/AcrR family transcriptional regulator C-terminal domain-containing protein [Dactylosporangium aurantiacum]|uniref:TetR/AcrR family transcriptional regulator C-terminal domain-containing protein n=1 Tax=Dactylosporangium aurantiacum TaxID=35754 RepID=A0A9Q9IAA2_9ACTN|nr:TetR/AcrR family transcriptional regulator C-terminal domain-containing protein [Dactylosporangium aurantiacum]MDG6101880.1 TetR/AcrR family transcriptional regulator C-terminal domain-containing protein [Dactylosporangium aurantiacum]UWZ52322.1 TetR/AcrR family transcriptional regulator C-terminal domain-containing protein [Dactylosporangium aurantiacum]
MTLTAADIVARLRQRIVTGELETDDELSFRDIMAEWDVSMHIAFKALRLMRDEGLTMKVPGIHGMVVTEDAFDIALAWRPAPEPPVVSEAAARVVRTAIELADAEGLAAVSMRRIGEQLGIATMTAHRHAGNRAGLETMMADAIFAGHPPPQSPGGDWRARLELLCRTQWQLYRERPWLARTVSFQPSKHTAHVVAHAEWAARTLREHGLAEPAATQVAATVADFVRGAALDLAREPADPDEDTELFEFGLRRLLDGIAPLIP